MMMIRMTIAVALFALNGLTARGAPPEKLDVAAWLAEGAPGETTHAFHRAPYFVEGVRFAERRYGVRALGRADVQTTGFEARDGRSGTYWFARVRPGGEPARIEWHYEGTGGARSAYRVFVGLVNAVTGESGTERIRLSHNGFVLGEFEPTRRRGLPYAYPYFWDEADARGDVPMELSFEPTWQLFLEGFTLRERRMFAAGDVLTVEAVTPGTYGIRDLMLVPQTTTMGGLAQDMPWFEFKEWRWGPHAGRLQMAWVTRHAARCTLLWNTNRDALQRGEGWVWRGTRYGENHQHFIPLPEQHGATVHAQVLMESDTGQRHASGIHSFTPAPAPTQREQGRLALAPIVRTGEISASAALAMIPFAPGVLVDPLHTHLADAASGAPLPAQPVVHSAWPDNSVRWLGVHFQSATATQDVVFTYGPNQRAAPARDPVKVHATGETIRLVRGDAEWVFDRRANGAIPRIQEEPICALVLEDEAGRRVTPGPPEALDVELEGPMHARIHARGHFQHDDQRLFEYILRWRVDAGTTDIDLEVTIGNDAEDLNRMYAPQRTLTRARSLYLEVPSDGSVEAGLGTAWTVIPDGRRLFQHDEQQVVGLDHALTKGRLTGRIRTAGGRYEVEDFWQQFPKSIEHTNGLLRIGLMPSLAGISYADWPATLRQQLLFFVRDDAYRIMAGTRKTHRIRFSPTDTSSATPSSARAVPLGPRLYAAAPEYTTGTGVFGPLDTPGTSAFTGIETWIENAYRAIVANRDRNREFGLLNFGDWFGERDVNWGNLEYDLGMAAAAQFLRSNDPRWFTLGLQAVRHQSEIDVLQFGRNAGLQPQHAGGHLGREYFHEDGFVTVADFRRAGWPRQPYNQTFHGGHMWSVGMANYAAMTGCPRLRDTVDLIGRRRGATASYALNGQHHRGWNLLAFAGAYSHFGDPFFLNAGRITLDRYEAVVDPASGVVWPTVYDHNTIGAVNRQSILFYGLLTGDTRAQAIFQRSLLTLHELWDPEVEGIVTEQHGWWAVRRADSVWAAVMAAGAAMTNDDRYRDMLRSHLRGGFDSVPGHTKDISSQLLYAPYFPTLLSRAGLSALPADPVPQTVIQAREAGGRRGLQPPRTHPPKLRDTGNPPAKPARESSSDSE
jgi:hypothetical protein